MDSSKLFNKSFELAHKRREYEFLYESDVKALQGHYDQIINRITEIKRTDEEAMKNNLNKANAEAIDIGRKLKQLRDAVDFIESNKGTMSDYSLLDNVRMWRQQYNKIKKSEWLMHFKRIPLNDCLQKTISVELVANETIPFQYKNNPTRILEAFDEDACYIQAMASENTHQINTQGARNQSLMFNISDLCVCDDGVVYFTDNENNAICRLSPSGSVSTIFNTNPQIPLGICQSITGDLLVTQIPSNLELSRPYCYCEDFYYCHYFPPLLQLTLTGEKKHEFKLKDEDPPIVYPRRIAQNGNHDICVVNWTASTGNLFLLSSSGLIKFVYSGQNLEVPNVCQTREIFDPYDVVCDSLCNILVSDAKNHKFHLLSPFGTFVKFLLTLNFPTSLSLYKSTLWVGNTSGLVKVFRCKHMINIPI